MVEPLDPEIERELSRFRERYRKLMGRLPPGNGPPRWATPNETVLASGAMRVRRFEPPPRPGKPVLIVYSHVNSPHVIDLHRDHSLVRRLIEAGHTVYLLDWGKVDERDRHADLSVYAGDYIDAALDCIVEHHGTDRSNLLGVCQGGTFALCYTALNPDRVDRLVTLVTPVDFHAGDSILARWVKYVDFTLLEQSPVNIPGEAITALFRVIRPFNDLKRQVQLIDRPVNDDKLELTALVDQWVYHCPDQPGRAFAQFARLFFQENRLVGGSLEIGSNAVRLDRISRPVLNVYAGRDHLVPPESSAALAKHIDPGLYHERVFPGGHVGLMVSEKAQQTVLPGIGSWLAGPA